MEIGHLAMYVRDLKKAKEFFEKYFRAKSGQEYHNQKTGFRSFFLDFDGGCRLELMNRPDIMDQEKFKYRTGFIHMAFCLGSREKVDELTKRLQEDGYCVTSGQRVTGDGYYESCIIGIEDNQIEITV